MILNWFRKRRERKLRERLVVLQERLSFYGGMHLPGKPGVKPYFIIEEIAKAREEKAVIESRLNEAIVQDAEHCIK